MDSYSSGQVDLPVHSTRYSDAQSVCQVLHTISEVNSRCIDRHTVMRYVSVRLGLKREECVIDVFWPLAPLLLRECNVFLDSNFGEASMWRVQLSCGHTDRPQRMLLQQTAHTTASRTINYPQAAGPCVIMKALHAQSGGTLYESIE